LYLLLLFWLLKHLTHRLLLFRHLQHLMHQLLWLLSGVDVGVVEGSRLLLLW
jgi:hypothetical protein